MTEAFWDKVACLLNSEGPSKSTPYEWRSVKTDLLIT